MRRWRHLLMVGALVLCTGCAAVTDRDMAEIFGLVRPGTPIFIKP